MPVVMKGGSSGNRESGLPPAAPSFDRQPVQDTSNNSGVGPGVNMRASDENRHIKGSHPPVPQGGSPNDAAV